MIRHNDASSSASHRVVAPVNASSVPAVLVLPTRHAERAVSVGLIEEVFNELVAETEKSLARLSLSPRANFFDEMKDRAITKMTKYFDENL